MSDEKLFVEAAKFWWDFDSDRSCVQVHSNDPRLYIVARFYFIKEANSAISSAENLIDDLYLRRVIVQ